MPEGRLVGVMRACGRGQGVEVGVAAVMAPPPPRPLLQAARKKRVNTARTNKIPKIINKQITY